MQNLFSKFGKAFLAASMFVDPTVCFANYEAPVLQASIGTTFKTAGALWSTGTRRMQLYEAEFSQTGALSSTDCQVQWDLSRFGATAILTATAVVPNLLDIADSSPLAQFANNATAELTYTTAGFGLSLKSWAINQRGSYRWRCLDDGDQIMMPATAVTGIGLRALSSNFTASAIGNISFVER